MGRQLTNAASRAEDDTDPPGLRRGLGQAGTPIPAYRTLGVEVRRAVGGSAVVRMPVSSHLAASAGGLLPGAFAVLADSCCGCAVATVLPAGGAALTAQLRVEFIRPLPPGQAWIDGRAEADAVEDDSGLARGEIVDQADQLLGVASLRIIKASHPGFGPPAPAPQPQPSQPQPSQPQPSQPQPSRARSAPCPAQPQADTPPGPLLGVVSRQADSGQSAWMFRPPPGAANSFGMVHGGVLGLLAHEVASDAQRSLIGPGEELIPLDLVVNFYRGVPASGRLAAATARVTHRGRRFVVAEGEVAGPGGRPALRLSVGAQVRGARAGESA